MTNRIKSVILIGAIVVVPMLLWEAAAILRDRQIAERSHADAEETRAGLCLDDAGHRYSHGSLLRTKRGSIKCDHGHWIVEAPR